MEEQLLPVILLMIQGKWFSFIRDNTNDYSCRNIINSP
jgi:hypothetical protein